MANNIGWGQGAINNVINWGQGAWTNLISWGISQSISWSGETTIYEMLSPAVKAYVDRVLADGGVVESVDCVNDDLSETASLQMTPGGYKATKLYSVLPVPVYGEELVVNGDFDTDSDWTLYDGSIINEGSLNLTTTTTYALKALQSIGISFNKTYRVEFNIFNYVSGNLKIILGNTSNGVSTDVIHSDGNYVFELKITSQLIPSEMSIISWDTNFTGSIDNISVKEVLVSDGDFTVDRDCEKTRVNADGIIETIGNNVPSIDYSDGGCPVLLTEPQSVNLDLWSEDFSNVVWERTSGLTVDVNEIISPDGLQNADKITLQSTGYIVQGATFGGNGDICQSFYVKKGTCNIVKIRELYYFGNSITFDLNDGSIVSGATEGGVESLHNDWYRIWITNNYSSQTFLAYALESTQVGYLYIWGAQLEQGSKATSYIPTQGSTVTRLQDVVKDAGDVTTFNSEEGVLYCEIAALADDLTPRYLTINDGVDLNNGISIRYYTAENQIQALYYSDGAFQCVLSNILNDSTEFNKIAFVYKENLFQLWVNGVKVAEDLNGTVNANLTKLEYQQTSGTNKFFSKTKQLKVFKTALSDAELIELTTP